ncbi:hypothetical protein L1887_19612 [Cichorium endivia]|nr:hypothetical protein L1887_19612 [Cichorium endivia]
MSRAPSYSVVRKLVPSLVEDGQSRGGADNTNNKPLSFQHVAPRPPSLIQDRAIQDVTANPPSLNDVNPHQSSSGAEHLKVQDWSTTQPPAPSAGGYARADRN